MTTICRIKITIKIVKLSLAEDTLPPDKRCEAVGVRVREGFPPWTGVLSDFGCRDLDEDIFSPDRKPDRGDDAFHP